MYIFELHIYGNIIYIKSPIDKEIFMNNVYDKSSKVVGTGWYDFEDANGEENYSVRIRDISVVKDITKKFNQTKQLIKEVSNENASDTLQSSRLEKRSSKT